MALFFLLYPYSIVSWSLEPNLFYVNKQKKSHPETKPFTRFVLFWFLMFLPTFLVLLCLAISTSLIRRKKKKERKRRKGKKKGFTGRISNDKTSEAIQDKKRVDSKACFYLTMWGTRQLASAMVIFYCSTEFKGNGYRTASKLNNSKKNLWRLCLYLCL